jgi:hypothetical protein
MSPRYVGLEKIEAIVDDLDDLIGYGLTFKEALELLTGKAEAFKEREQEDEDKPWAKPT